MYRGNEMMAAFARAQLARLPERTARCQRNAGDWRTRSPSSPGSPASRRAGRTSVHHKFRVQLDPEGRASRFRRPALRDATSQALAAEGLEVVSWQSAPLPSHAVFHRRDPALGFPAPSRGRHRPRRQLRPRALSRTRALLDGSIVLFSQSCPLIAQPDSIVDRYIEAFRRVWNRRTALAAWAQRGLPKPA